MSPLLHTMLELQKGSDGENNEPEDSRALKHRVFRATSEGIATGQLAKVEIGKGHVRVLAGDTRKQPALERTPYESFFRQSVTEGVELTPQI